MTPLMLSGLPIVLFTWGMTTSMGCETPRPATSPDRSAPQSASSGESGHSQGDPDSSAAIEAGDRTPSTVRVATFNTSLHGDRQGDMLERLDDPEAEAPRKIAEIIQRIRPDLLLINEFDRVEEKRAVERFQRHFLERAQNGAEPIQYPHTFVPRVNTGLPSGHDLDQNGRVVSTPGSEAYAGDAYGYGTYPGQYGMVVMSTYPLERSGLRSFRTFLWRTMPDNQLPEEWYSPEAIEDLRLSSKTHLDLPVSVGETTLHLLASHPTPPAFGGASRRNRRRNHDEIRFWHDYIDPERGRYIVDDKGRSGGLADTTPFVIVGDLNADPEDGAPRSRDAISTLLEHPRTQDPRPSSEGGAAAAHRDGGANDDHTGDPTLDTADFEDDETGNLRVDYVLPSDQLELRDAGVFWPRPGADHADLVEASDHRLVWVDIALPD